MSSCNVRMRTYLTSRGYALWKDELGEQRTQELRRELTVTPQGGLTGLVARPEPILAYRESSAKIYVPKCFGLNRFGQPTCRDGVRDACGAIDVTFEGALREDQQKAVDAFMTAALDPLRRGGIVNVPCGGGKTVIALHVMTRLAVKTMIVVHKDFLLDQWRERLGEFVPSARIGLIKGPVTDVLEKDVVIASLQSLSMKEYPPSTFDDFGFVIFDEVHRAATEIFSGALTKVCFHHSMGLSATVDRKDGLSCVFMWHLGDIVHRARRGDEDGVLVHALNFSCADPEYRLEEYACTGRLNTSRLINRVCAYAPRTEVIAQRIQRMVQSEGRKVLVLSDRKAQLRELERGLGAAGVSVGMYVGGMSAEALQKSQGCAVLLATYSFASEGFDAKGLDTLVMASPKTDIEQSVGRILRTRPADRARPPIVVDVIDCIPVFQGQWRKRQAWFRAQGYRILYNRPVEDEESETKLLNEGLCKLFGA